MYHNLAWHLPEGPRKEFYYRKAIELDPYLAVKSRLNLGQILQARGEHREALAVGLIR